MYLEQKKNQTKQTNKQKTTTTKPQNNTTYKYILLS